MSSIKLELTRPQAKAIYRNLEGLASSPMLPTGEARIIETILKKIEEAFNV